jgi:hypothetical protein
MEGERCRVEVQWQTNDNSGHLLPTAESILARDAGQIRALLETAGGDLISCKDTMEVIFSVPAKSESVP